MHFTNKPPAPRPNPDQDFPRPARPEDAESLRQWVAALGRAVWPDISDYPPFTLDTGGLREWHSSLPWVDERPLVAFHRADLDDTPVLMQRYRAPDQFADEADWQAFYRSRCTYLVMVGGLAHIASRVRVADEFTGYYPDEVREFRPLPHYQGRVPVALESWDRLPLPQDTPGLWLWSLADRTEVTGHQSRRAKAAGEGQLEPALNTAQAIHDALALYLPQITDTPTTNPPRKVSQWR